jgi:hypothetical protein
MMTETEWSACADVQQMLAHVESDRKLRLFSAACCRRLGPLLVEETLNVSVDVLERYADGMATHEELVGAHKAAEAVREILRNDYQRSHLGRGNAALAVTGALLDRDLGHTPGVACVFAAGAAAAAMSDASNPSAEPTIRAAGIAAEQGAQVVLVRDIFDNPFRPVEFVHQWRTADVLGLARGIYEDRAFDRLPILADALIDAGCDNEDILAHCRSDGPHVRGCWVVDHILRKT